MSVHIGREATTLTGYAEARSSAVKPGEHKAFQRNIEQHS